jgi:hypothetical protein
VKQNIDVTQVKTLSPVAREHLDEWFAESWIEWDDDFAYVYIPEEETGDNDGRFRGLWGSEQEFTFPQEYVGKISNYEGTILPLMDITQMLQFLEDHDQAYKPVPIAELCDNLWEQVRAILEEGHS